MAEEKMLEVLNKRIGELARDPEVRKVLKKKFQELGEEGARQWLHDQALITLLYSPEEREEMVRGKAA